MVLLLAGVQGDVGPGETVCLLDSGWIGFDATTLLGVHTYIHGGHTYIHGGHTYIHGGHTYIHGGHTYIHGDHTYVDRLQRSVGAVKMFLGFCAPGISEQVLKRSEDDGAR